ncbi:MAG: hypothetical protein JXR63_03050 [Spirochaetales bacterium]|nr:hypothetical protein [Spirochaetales bacterium]
MKILFVCSSNVCRSPFAELYTKYLLEKKPSRTNIEWIQSSAVFNRSKEIFPKTKTYLLKNGVSEESINNFSPSFKKTHPERFEEADIIIGMTKTHKWETPRKFRKKFITLSELVDKRYKAIPDPFLKSAKNYDKSMDILKKYIVKYSETL